MRGMRHRSLEVVLGSLLVVSPLAGIACVGDDPVAGADAASSPALDAAPTPAPSATTDPTLLDGAAPDSATLPGTDASAPCGPPRLGPTTTEDVLAGTALAVTDFTYDCASYFAVTTAGSVLRRGFAETQWLTIVPTGSVKSEWYLQADDLGVVISPNETASFMGPPGTPQTALEAIRYDRNGTGKSVLFSEAAPNVQTSIRFSGPFQRTANTIAFLGTSSNRSVTVTNKRAPAQATVSAGLGFLSKSVTFETGGLSATPGMLAWARPETPGSPPQIAVEGNPRTTTIQTLTGSPRSTTAALSGFRGITEEHALFRATTAQGTPTLAACALQANGACGVLDAAPWKPVRDYQVIATSAVATDGKTFAVLLVGPAGMGSAVSLCDTASYARDNSCASAKIVADSPGPAGTRIALSRSDIFVESLGSSGRPVWTRYPRP